jgi:FAD synthetase
MKTRILIFGTYDGIHEGHRSFFAQARALAPNPLLIVSLARDVNVKKVKGKLPFETEQERKAALEKEILVDEVVLGALDDDYIAHVLSERPDIIALGYDQNGTTYTDSLAEKLSRAGCTARIVRCEPYKPEIYKSSKLQR